MKIQSLNFLISTIIAITAIVAGLAFHFVVSRLLLRQHRRKPFLFGDIPLRLDYWVGPLRALVPAVFLSSVLSLLEYPPGLISVIKQTLILWTIGSIAWLVIRTIAVAREMILSRFDLTHSDNLRARSVATQMRVLERVVVFVVLLLALAGMLMTFSAVREVGMSILASAGLLGLIIGFAAQRSIATLLAGLHIAITQPIRLQDGVVVEGEFGYIEEITLSYVVVKIWDERRMIVPITHFIEKPFQNWTRTSSELIGSVYIYSDHRLPVQRVREELRTILESTSLWDGRVSALQLTEASPESVQLRALVSAENASKTWDLRCYVREKLVEFVRETLPGSLPRTRVELDNQEYRCNHLFDVSGRPDLSQTEGS